MLRTIQLYEQLSYFESSAEFKGELVSLVQYLKQVKNDLDSQVSHLCANLHAQLTSEKLPNKTGFFTGIHQWWKNLWGRDDKKNPYYWQNRIGALGRTDLDPPTVEEYRMLNDLATSLAEAVESGPQPLITKILTNWSGRLRGVVGAYMDSMISRVEKVAGMAPSVKSEPVKPSDVPPAKKPADEKKGKVDPVDPDIEATKAAWESIKDFASDDEIAEFRKYADRKLWKDAIAYAQDLLAKRSKTPLKPSARMPDVDDEDDPGAAPAKTTPKSLDDEAAELGITPDMKTNLGGAFKSLPPALKKLVIDQCRKGMPECPVGREDDDNILAHLSSVEIHKILRKHEGKSVENIKKGAEKIDDTQEREVILAVHAPWLSLTPGERKYHNDQGSLNVPLKSHNRVINGLTYPFRIPPVLRKEDPRFQILQDYYPEHFRKLNIVGRVERPEDTEATIEKRIKRNIRSGKVSGEFSAERAEDAGEPEARPGKSPMGETPGPAEKKKKKPLLKTRMPAHPEDEIPESVKDMVKSFPDEIGGAIMKLAEKSEDQAREVAQVWVKIKDEKRSIKKRFKEMLDEGDVDGILALAHDEANDDDIRDMLSHYQPKGPSLLEALKTRLRLQREGKANAWEPLPDKVTPKVLVERLRRQSSKLYQES